MDDQQFNMLDLVTIYEQQWTKKKKVSEEYHGMAVADP
jgi:hypothetical protein